MEAPVYVSIYIMHLHKSIRLLFVKRIEGTFGKMTENEEEEDIVSLQNIVIRNKRKKNRHFSNFRSTYDSHMNRWKLDRDIFLKKKKKSISHCPLLSFASVFCARRQILCQVGISSLPRIAGTATYPSDSVIAIPVAFLFAQS